MSHTPVNFSHLTPLFNPSIFKFRAFLKFQSLTVPSGLIANLFGPVGTFFERKLKFGYCCQQFNFTCAKFYTRLKKKEKRKSINEGNEAKEIL